MRQNRYCLSITKISVSASDIGNENWKTSVSAQKKLIGQALVWSEKCDLSYVCEVRNVICHMCVKWEMWFFVCVWSEKCDLSYVCEVRNVICHMCVKWEMWFVIWVWSEKCDLSHVCEVRNVICHMCVKWEM